MKAQTCQKLHIDVHHSALQLHMCSFARSLLLINRWLVALSHLEDMNVTGVHVTDFLMEIRAPTFRPSIHQAVTRQACMSRRLLAAGNLPYYITTETIRKLLPWGHTFSALHFVIQVHRVTACFLLRVLIESPSLGQSYAASTSSVYIV